MKILLTLALSILLTGCVNSRYPMIPLSYSMRKSLNESYKRANQFNAEYSRLWSVGWKAGYDGLPMTVPDDTEAAQTGWTEGYKSGFSIRTRKQSYGKSEETYDATGGR